jgi:hypothetical protein
VSESYERLQKVNEALEDFGDWHERYDALLAAVQTELGQGGHETPTRARLRAAFKAVQEKKAR